MNSDARSVASGHGSGVETLSDNPDSSYSLNSSKSIGPPALKRSESGDAEDSANAPPLKAFRQLPFMHATETKKVKKSKSCKKMTQVVPSEFTWDEKSLESSNCSVASSLSNSLLPKSLSESTSTQVLSIGATSELKDQKASLGVDKGRLKPVSSDALSLTKENNSSKISEKTIVIKDPSTGAKSKRGEAALKSSKSAAISKNSHAKSLFENLDKNWRSLKEEQICFCSAVRVLFSSSESVDSAVLIKFWKCTMPEVDATKVLATLVDSFHYLKLSSSKKYHQSDDENIPNQKVTLSHKVYGDYATYLYSKLDFESNEKENKLESWHASLAEFLDDHLRQQPDVALTPISLYAAKYLPHHLQLANDPVKWKQLMSDPKWVCIRLKVMIHDDSGMSLLEAVNWHLQTLEQASETSFCVASSSGNALPSSTFLRETLEHLSLYDILKENLMQVAKEIKVRLDEEANTEDAEDDDIIASRSEEAKKKKKKAKSSRTRKESDKKRSSRDPQKTTTTETSLTHEKSRSELKKSNSDTSFKSSSTGKKKRRKKKRAGSKGFASSPLLQEYLEVNNDMHENISIASSLSEEDLIIEDDRSRVSRGSSRKNNATMSDNGVPWKNPGDYTTSTDYDSKDTNLGNSSNDQEQKSGVYSKSSTTFKSLSEIESGGMNLSDVLEINIDSIEVDMCTARCLWTIGTSLENYANTLSQSETAAGSAVAKFITKTVTLSLTTYVNCTHILSYLISDDLEDIDEDDLHDVGYTGSLKPCALLQKLTNDRIQARTLMEKLRVLSADSWYTLGQNTKNFVEKSWLTLEDVLKLGLIDQAENNDPVRVCYENALTLLTNSSLANENKSRNRKLPALGMLFHASMRHVLTHLLVLKYNVWHALGVFFMEHDLESEAKEIENDRALKCFEQSVSGRRKLLTRLQEEDENYLNKLDDERNNGSSSSLMTSPSRGTSSSMKSKKTGDIFFSPSGNIIASVEMALSSSLEYAALCHHAQGNYDDSLSLFQDALILRALHQGKNSLQVASLQYNMGVVHDDLGQHEASLGRYGESLRIRLLHEDEEIKPSIILTLRCMGSVYRALQDFTNSIHCYIKAIDKLKDRLTSMEMKLGFHPDLPRPFYVLDEMHSHQKQDEEKNDDNELAIAKVGEETIKNPMPLEVKKFDMNALSEEDRVRKDIASMYTTILSLIEMKNDIDESALKNYKVNSGYSSGGYASGGNGYSSGGSRSSRSAYSTSSKKSKRVSGEQDEDKILLNAAYYLGSSSMYFGDYHTAIVYLEESLRTLWTLFPAGSSSGESSDSDSSISAESKRGSETKSSDSKNSGKRSNGDYSGRELKNTVVEEGVLYHSLALCHAMRGDHERAVRCYVTALRYYRRRLGMENLSVAGALYDCGLSYWYISEYTRAGEFWSDCVRILLVTEGRQKIHELNLARALYNLAASSCAKNEYLEPYTLTCLKDAQKIFNQHELHEEVAHCHFYIGLIHFKLGLSLHTNECGKEMSPKIQELTSDVNTLRITDAVIHAESFQRDDSIAKAIRDFKYEERESFSGEDHLRFAMSCIDDALGIYLSRPKGSGTHVKKSSVENNEDNSLHPLQAHIALLSGAIHHALGSMSKAIWHYTTSIRFLNRYYKTSTNLYSAHALYAMGVLFHRSNNMTAAMKCFNGCLDVRRLLLGSKHSAVGEALFELASAHDRIGDYKTCIVLYADCLRIRLLTDGYDASSVAKVLINMGIAHARFGFYHKAMECLEGALKIRKGRVQSLETKLMAAGALQEQKEVAVSEGGMHELEAEAYDEESELAHVLHNIGNVHLKNGRFDMALRCYQETLNLRRRHCGFGDGGFGEIGYGTPKEMLQFNEDLKYMSETLHNMGWVYEIMGIYDKALSHLNESLVIKRAVALNNEPPSIRITEDNSLESAMTLLRIGSVHVRLTNYDIALSYYESAIKIQRRLLGKNHLVVARTLVDMGHILWKRFNESSELMVVRGKEVPVPDHRSLQCFSESLRIARHNFGPNHACVAQVMYDLGCQYDLQGQQNKAVNCFKGSLRIHGRRYARALCRRLFEGIPMNVPNHAIATSHESEVELFGGSTSASPMNPSNGLTSPFSPIVLIPPGPIRDREQYLLASQALRKSVLKLSKGESICFGLLDSNNKVSSIKEICWTKLELLLLRFMEILTAHAVEPVRDVVRNSVRESQRQISRITSHAIISSSDTMAHQFLVLIPE